MRHWTSKSTNFVQPDTDIVPAVWPFCSISVAMVGSGPKFWFYRTFIYGSTQMEMN